MNDEIIDVRIGKTFKKLEKAMCTLLKENELGEVSISMLCKEAGINRSTFYSYFKSVPELLHYLQKKYIEELTHQMSRYWGYRHDILLFYQDILTYIEKNKEIFYCLYSSDTNGFIDQTIASAVTQKKLPNFNYPKISQEDLNYVRIFTSYGINGIIKHWLMGNCKEPSEYIANLMYTYTKRIYLLD